MSKKDFFKEFVVFIILFFVVLSAKDLLSLEVNLISPENSSTYDISSNVSFQFNISSSTEFNYSVYTNMSGIWENNSFYNNDSVTGTDGSNVTFEVNISNFLDNTSYKWNVYACNSTTCLWGNETFNWTFTVDYNNAPNITNYLPNNDSTIFYPNNILLNFTCEDRDLDELNLSIYNGSEIISEKLLYNITISNGIGSIQYNLTVNFPDLSSGYYNFTYLCNDSLLTSNKTIYFYYDSMNFTDFDIVSPIKNLTNQELMFFNWTNTSHDVFSNYTLQITNDSFSTIVYNWTSDNDTQNTSIELNLIQILPNEGNFSWRVIATSIYGRTKISSNISWFYYDKTPPVVLNSYPDASNPFIVNTTNAHFVLYLNESSPYNNVTIHLKGPETAYGNYSLSECYYEINNKYNCSFEIDFNSGEPFYLSQDYSSIEIWYNITDIVGNNIRYPLLNNLSLTKDLIYPTNFDLISPFNSILIANRSPLFSWNETQEEHFDYYLLEISNSSAFEEENILFNKSTSENTTNTSIHLDDELPDNSTLFWRIIAYALPKLFETSSKYPIGIPHYTISDSNYSLSIDVSNPSEFTVLNYCNVYTNETQPEINWSGSSDFSFSNYTLYFSQNYSFNEIKYSYFVYDNDTTSYLIDDELEVDKNWFFKIIAYDELDHNTSTQICNYSLDVSSPIIEQSLIQDYFESNTNVQVNISVYENTSGINISKYYFRPHGDEFSYQNKFLDCTLNDNFTSVCTKILDLGSFGLTDGDLLDVYYYVKDNYGYESYVGNSTNPYNVYIDLNPPANFSLISPSNIHIQDETYLFDWENSDDNVSIENYSIIISNSSSFETENILLTNYTIGETNSSIELDLSTLENNQLYYWKVIVYDYANKNKTSNEFFNFTVDREEPLEFNITYPLKNHYYNNLSFNYLINWTNTSEPNFFNYTINLISNLNSSNNFTFYQTNRTNTTLNLTQVIGSYLNESNWSIEIIAYDLALNYYSEEIDFILDKTKPNSSNLLFPLNDSFINYLPILSWNESYDFYDDVLYNLTITNLTKQSFNLTYDSEFNFNETIFANFNLTNNSLLVENLHNKTFYWNLTYIDLANNTNYSQTFNFTLDFVKPNYDILNHNYNNFNLTNNETLYIEFNFSDDVSSCNNSEFFIKSNENITFQNLSLNKINSCNYNLSLNLTQLGYENENLIFYYFNYTDNANNTNSTPIFNFTLDYIFPTNFNLTIENQTYLNYSNINFTWNESYDINLLNYELFVYNSSDITQNYSYQTNNTWYNFSLSQGNWTYFVTAYDKVNHSIISNQNNSIFVDLTKPNDFELINPINDSYLNYYPILNWSESDDNYGVDYYQLKLCNESVCQVENLTQTNYSFNNSIFYQEGSYPETYFNWSVTVFDYADNLKNSLNETFYFTLDFKNPDFDMDPITPSNDYFNYTNITFQINFTDYTGIQNISLILNISNLTDSRKQDFEIFNGYSNNFYFVNESIELLSYLDEENSIFYYYNVTDYANNTLRTINFYFEYDNKTPPNFDLLTENNSIFNTSIFLEWNDSLDMHVSYYNVTVMNLTNTSINYTYTSQTNSKEINLPEGNWSWYVDVYDYFNRTNRSNQIHNFYVDNSSPNLFNLIYPNDLIFGNYSINFTWEESDDMHNLSYELDIYNFSNEILIQSCVTNNTWCNLSLEESDYYFNVIAIDQVGNEIISNQSFNFSVDLSPPVNLSILNYETKDKSSYFNLKSNENFSLNTSLYLNNSGTFILVDKDSFDYDGVFFDGTNHSINFSLGNMSANNTYLLNYSLNDLYNNSINYSYVFNSSEYDIFTPSLIYNLSISNTYSDTITFSWDYDNKEYFFWDFNRTELYLFNESNNLVNSTNITNYNIINHTFSNLEFSHQYNLTISVCDNLSCYDNFSLSGNSITNPPNIDLIYPINLEKNHTWENDIKNISFVFNVTDDVENYPEDYNQINCSLYYNNSLIKDSLVYLNEITNWTLNLTQIPNVYDKLDYTLECVDPSLAKNEIDVNLTINDFYPPKIQRIYPIEVQVNKSNYEGVEDFNTTSFFRFSIENNDLIENCTIGITDNINPSLKTTYSKSELENFIILNKSYYEIEEGELKDLVNYFWNIGCFDEHGNLAIGNNYSLINDGSANSLNLVFPSDQQRNFTMYINDPGYSENITLDSYHKLNISNSSFVNFSWDYFDPEDDNLSFKIYTKLLENETTSEYEFINLTTQNNIYFEQNQGRYELLIKTNDSIIVTNNSFNFSIDIEDPTNFDLLIENKTFFNESNVNLTWNESFDLSPINYSIILTNLTQGNDDELLNITNKTYFNHILSDGYYKYEVIAKDHFNQQTNSSSKTYFYVDTKNPSKSNLSSPENNTLSSNNHVNFVAQTSYDENEVNYYLEISNVTNFSELKFVSNKLETPSTKPLLNFSDDTLYWRIKTIDLAGNYNYSNYFVYIIDRKYPDLVQAITPVNNSRFNIIPDNFSWTKTNDSHFSNYTFYLYNYSANICIENVNCSQNLSDYIIYNQTLDNINHTNLSIVNLENYLIENNKYYWDVYFYDELGNYNFSRFNFVYDTKSPNLYLENYSHDDYFNLSFNFKENISENLFYEDVNASLYFNDTFQENFIGNNFSFQKINLIENTTYNLVINGSDDANNSFNFEFNITTDIGPKISVNSSNISMNSDYNILINTNEMSYCDVFNLENNLSFSSLELNQTHNISIDLESGFNNLNITCYDQKEIEKNISFIFYYDDIAPDVTFYNQCNQSNPCVDDDSFYFNISDIINISYWQINYFNRSYNKSFNESTYSNFLNDYQNLTFDKGGRQNLNLYVLDINNNSKNYSKIIYVKEKTNLTKWLNDQNNVINLTKNNLVSQNKSKNLSIKLNLTLSNGSSLNDLDENDLNDSFNLNFEINNTLQKFNGTNYNNISHLLRLEFFNISSYLFDWDKNLNLSTDKNIVENLIEIYGTNYSDDFINVDLNDFINLTMLNYSARIYFENKSYDNFYWCNETTCQIVGNESDGINPYYEYDNIKDEIIIYTKHFSSFFGSNDTLAARPILLENNFNDSYNVELNFTSMENLTLNLSYISENITFSRSDNFNRKLIGNNYNNTFLGYSNRFKDGVFLDGSYDVIASYCDDLNNCDNYTYVISINDDYYPSANVSESTTISGTNKTTTYEIRFNFSEPSKVYINDELILDYINFSVSNNYDLNLTLNKGNNNYDFKFVDFNSNQKVISRNYYFSTTYEEDNSDSSNDDDTSSSSSGSSTSGGYLPTPIERNETDEIINETSGEDEKIDTNLSSYDDYTLVNFTSSRFNFNTQDSILKRIVIFSDENISNAFIEFEKLDSNEYSNIELDSYDLKNVYSFSIFDAYNYVNNNFTKKYYSFDPIISEFYIDKSVNLEFTKDVLFYDFLNDEEISILDSTEYDGYLFFQIEVNNPSLVGLYHKKKVDDSKNETNITDDVNDNINDAIDDVNTNFNFIYVILPTILFISFGLLFLSKKSSFYESIMDESFISLMDYILENSASNKSDVYELLVNSGWSKKQVKKALVSSEYLKGNYYSQLVTYISNLKSRNYTNEQILRTLQKAGWKKEVINYVLIKQGL